MRLLAFSLAAACSVTFACPAAAIVSLSVNGTFLKDNDSIRQALGLDTLNPRFSAGLLLSFDASPLSDSYTMKNQNSYQVNANGVIVKSTPWWGYAINSYELSSANYSVAWDHDRADADDPTYPLWSIPSGNNMVIMFDWGVVPELLRFDLDADFEQTRHTSFRGVSTGTTQPYPDEENIASTLAPSHVENGTIGCTSSQGAETMVWTTAVGFQPAIYSSTVNTRCSISLNARAFVPVAPPPALEVPEPSAWGMMILGFGLVGHSLRRRRVKVA